MHTQSQDTSPKSSPKQDDHAAASAAVSPERLVAPHEDVVHPDVQHEIRNAEAQGQIAWDGWASRKLQQKRETIVGLTRQKGHIKKIKPLKNLKGKKTKLKAF